MKEKDLPRSVQRRLAHQRGEKAPAFEKAKVEVDVLAGLSQDRNAMIKIHGILQDGFSMDWTVQRIKEAVEDTGRVVSKHP